MWSKFRYWFVNKFTLAFGSNQKYAVYALNFKQTFDMNVL
jgi:hypothetical protein